ncbi:hypothetical protein CHARACLAT_017832 [Characodon lateralis]|uniref:Uncharacterized protein n=1 Tax=Characodon lateralis TaxID=208331 RepID=A0ABU7E2U2_9TELE|nr:hypothetical protein [Characodon lateralis]
MATAAGDNRCCWQGAENITKNQPNLKRMVTDLRAQSCKTSCRTPPSLINNDHRAHLFHDSITQSAVLAGDLLTP